ncbi:hypothetical protein CNMCM5623_009566 [Aspergillus felis]|uniref:Uncharacterized protein n=1 Tax=Aspergillus felis TaxID=1287682 RepID=A0A8H6Q2R1_9EURO|nr:hypothetical protein CNMCM5623_009566 [Aspergillus felis]
MQASWFDSHPLANANDSDIALNLEYRTTESEDFTEATVKSMSVRQQLLLGFQQTAAKLPRNSPETPNQMFPCPGRRSHMFAQYGLLPKDSCRNRPEAQCLEMQWNSGPILDTPVRRHDGPTKASSEIYTTPSILADTQPQRLQGMEMIRALPLA